MPTDDILRTLLMYFVLPAWLAAGFADYLCHRAAHIERTSGWKESVLHLLQFAEMALPILAALFSPPPAPSHGNVGCGYAAATREVKPIEQHVRGLRYAGA